MKAIFIITIVLLTTSLHGNAQSILSGKDWSVNISEQGKIMTYTTNKGGQEELVQFRVDEHAGPAFEGVELSADKDGKFLYSGRRGDIRYSLQYKNDNGVLLVDACIENTGNKIYLPKYERLILGLNTYMEKYPNWNDKFFPTMLRSEKTHFWGYAMTPSERVFAFASPDPLASWNYEYFNYGNIENHEKALRTGHRIFTVSMDVLHCLPLPDRHPQHLTKIEPGNKVSFKLYMKELAGLDDLSDFYSELTKAPVIELENYTVAAKYESVKGTIRADTKPHVMVFGPQNYATEIGIKEVGDNLYCFEFKANRGVGNYRITAQTDNGKISEAIAYFRDDWSWYLNQARKEALEAKPTDTHHAECFYPLYTYFLARRYLPNKEVDDKCEEIYNEIFSVLYDPTVKEMRDGKFRIQDAATMIGVLTDRYQVTGDIKDMENAAGLVDFLIKKQREDGAYYNGHRHYTSVIYLAKSIMEYLESAKVLADAYPDWKPIYKKHYDSVKRSVDDLAKRKDDVQTEGQMTFEDGMISCSATQLALAALREPEEHKKKEYTDASLYLTDKHQCLTLLRTPDSRMYGATLRFWESQYTVNLMHGNMNTPCGWSAWKTYGIWYQYLLTGNEEFLKLAMNELGTFMQLIDYETGRFRFSFAPDPYIEAEQYLETPIGSGKAELQPVIIGEQYIEPISYWHRYPHETWRKKWGIDNFNHEVIKCMTEISLANAYVVELEDGQFNSYGCELTLNGNTLVVIAKESLTDKLHVNLKNTYDIEFRAKTTETYKNIFGMKWVNGIPDLIKVYPQPE